MDNSHQSAGEAAGDPREDLDVLVLNWKDGEWLHKRDVLLLLRRLSDRPSSPFPGGGLVWTREKPTREGDYCFRYGPGHPREFLSVERVAKYGGVLQYWHLTHECYYDLPDGEWAGPIPEPTGGPNG